MKNKKRNVSIISLVAFFVALFISTNFSYASETVINVTHYGADSTGESDSRVAIQQVLNMAMNMPDGDTLTVIIPEGTYKVEGNLHIYSNTQVIATGATIKGSGFQGSLLKGAHTHDGVRCTAEDQMGTLAGPCSSGGYTQTHDVIIDGGTWDAGCATESTRNAQCIQFRHSNNITLKNLTVTGSTNHMINLAASKDVTLTNVTCKNAVIYTGKKPGEEGATPEEEAFWYGTSDSIERFRAIEAVHLDFANSAGENWIGPKDGTGVKNITIDNCTFENVFAGVGTHHLNHEFFGADNSIAENITVKDCTFTNLKSGETAVEFGNAFYMKSANNVVIENNTINNARSLADLEEVTNFTIQNNTAAGLRQNGVYIRNCGDTSEINNSIKNTSIDVTNDETSGIWITSNLKTVDSNDAKISKTKVVVLTDEATTGVSVSGGKHGIGIEGDTNVKVSNYTISAQNGHGIYAANGATLEAEGNTIPSPGKNGMYVDSVSSVLARNNTVLDAQETGIRVGNSAVVSIIDNTVDGCDSEGIWIAGCGDGAVVSGNTVQDTLNTGIGVKESGATTISGNNVTRAGTIGILGNNTKVTINENNKISNSGEDGIWLNSCKEGSLVQGNSVTSPTLSGIGAKDSGATTIRGNTVTNPGTIGILANNTKVTIDENNKVSNSGQDGIWLTSAIEGSVVEGNVVDSSSASGIGAKDSKATTISGNIVTKPGTIGILGNNSIIMINDNNISHSGQEGIWLTSCVEGSEVSGNTVTESQKVGIGVKDSGSTTISGNTVTKPSTIGILANNTKVTINGNNKVSDSGEDGIWLTSCADGSVINGNTVTSPELTGIGAKNTKVTISNNKVSDSVEDGIWLTSCKSGSLINDNTVTGSKKSGIGAKNTPTVTMSGNTITSSQGQGIIANNSKASIKSNNVSDIKAEGIWVTGCPDGTEVLNNTVKDVELVGIGVKNTATATVKNNTVTDAIGHGIYAGSDTGKNCTVVIDGNESISKHNNGKRDIIVWEFATNSVITNNTIGGRGMTPKNGDTTTYPGRVKTNHSNTVQGETPKPDIATASIGGISNKTYNGKAQTQTPTVKVGNTTLKSGTDYTVSYKNNTNAGTATVTITGKGNYTGTKTATFKINPAKVTVPTGKTLTYNGKSQTGVTAAANYTVSGNTGTNAKSYTATAKLRDKKNYTWSDGKTEDKKVTWKINPLSLAKASVTGVEDKPYTGKAITQTPTVTLGGKTLKNGTDYTLSYKNNTKAGTATMTVTGKGNYSGAVSEKFSIIAKSKIWERIAGQTGFDTMAAITKKFGTAKNAVIAANTDFKDSLAAAGLAGALKAPMMLTNPGGLPNQTRDELKRMGVTTVYLVGSTKDVSAATENQIKNLGIKVVRITGNTPSQKAVNVAKKQPERSDTVIIATPSGFKDALSISPYAYATKSPVLYSENNKKLSAATVNYIKSAKFKKAIIVGGYIALPLDIETQLKGAGISANNITRLAGANGYATSQVIAEWGQGKLKNGTGTNGQGKGAKDLYYYAMIKYQPSVRMTANNVGISRGDTGPNNWRDALAGAALCGKNRAILLLVHDENTSNTAVTKASKLQIAHGYVFGGEAAVGKKSWNALVNSTK